MTKDEPRKGRDQWTPPPLDTPEGAAVAELARKRVRVQRELEALNLVLRRAVWELHVSGWSQRQIAVTIGVTKGRVQQLLAEERRERQTVDGDGCA